MRVLVTGASGYTGARLVERLIVEGHNVRALVRNPKRAAPLRVLGARVVIGDVTKRASIAGIAANIDVVYHLVGGLGGGTAAMRQVMVDGTRNLVDQCQAHAGEHGSLRSFIFTSNAVVYGPGGGAVLNEDSPCQPTFPLGRLNLLAEQELRRAETEHNLPVTILRLGAIYGPGRLSSALIREGRFRIIGNGRSWISRIHIDDLLDVLSALGHAPRPGRLYCLADEEPCAVDDYYRHLADLLGVAPPRHTPAWYAWLRGRGRYALARLRGRPPFVDANVIGLFTTDLRLDTARLRTDLDHHLRYPSYRVGLPAALTAETVAVGTPA
ncbi:MAG TPA: NAD-dependent epimerase/dehydratase family protein [Chloroflexota bacterium]|nr:NAD-dependent epimerase/dehydratase family protein [Chloroflexota bacterium]